MTEGLLVPAGYPVVTESEIPSFEGESLWGGEAYRSEASVDPLGLDTSRSLFLRYARGQVEDSRFTGADPIGALERSEGLRLDRRLPSERLRFPRNSSHEL